MVVPPDPSLANAPPEGVTGNACLDVGLGFELVGDAQALNELLALARESLTRDVALIAQKIEENDVREANKLLHSLKGFAPIFCAQSLAEEIARVEILSKTCTAAELREPYHALRPRLSRLHDEIARYLGQ